MKLQVDSFETIAKKICCNHKKIIIYGAGMIGTVTTLSILREKQISSNIEFFVDADEQKWGTSISGILVYNKDILKKINGSKYVILIAISRFYELLEELNELPNLNDMDCYIIPMLCIDNFKPSEDSYIKKDDRNFSIPKIINYMWLGKKSASKSINNCIDSWKKYCPDYEIKCWNEQNYDVEKIPYMKQAYQAGAYGFVPDYARLDILYHYGGIYLDTDVELVCSLDDLLNQEAFCSVEKWQTINFGGGGGSVTGSEMIGKLLKEREQILFVKSNGMQNRNTCGYYDTLFFMKYGYQITGKIQNINGVTIYPYDVFHPYDYMSGRTDKTINTHGIHHFNGGWLDESQVEANLITSKNYNKIYNDAKFV